jgi:hypothetical protein
LCVLILASRLIGLPSSHRTQFHFTATGVAKYGVTSLCQLCSFVVTSVSYRTSSPIRPKIEVRCGKDRFHIFLFIGIADPFPLAA